MKASTGLTEEACTRTRSSLSAVRLWDVVAEARLCVEAVEGEGSHPVAQVTRGPMNGGREASGTSAGPRTNGLNPS